MSISSYVKVLAIMSGILVVLGVESQNPVPSVGAAVRVTTDSNQPEPDVNTQAPRAGDNGASSLVDKNGASIQNLSDNMKKEQTANVIASTSSVTGEQDKSERSDSTKSSSVIKNKDNSQEKMAPPAETRDRKQQRQQSSSHVDSEDSTDESLQFPSTLSDLSPAEKTQMLNSLESSFLSLVGLKSRPAPDNKVTIPPYMLELYKQHMQSQEGRRTRTKHHRGLHNSNTIRSFLSQDEDANLPDGIARLRFNITSLPSDEVLQAAELRLSRHASTLQNQLHLSNFSTEKLEEILATKHRIDIYQIVLPPKSSERRDPITRLLDTKVVDPTKTRSEIFDVTPALASWRTGSKNFGLEVRFSKVSGEKSPLHHVRLKRSTGSLENHNMDQNGPKRNWDSLGPLLVAYSQSPGATPNTNRRSKRDTRKHRDTRGRKGRSRNRERRKKRKDRKDRDYTRNCRRKQLYVDFHDVGWTDWIVAPPGYEAFYCSGECPFHLADHFNTTNHAVVQQFVHSVDPQDVPQACCVPTELSEVALLYIDEENNVVLRRYEEMVVEACGCR